MVKILKKNESAPGKVLYTVEFAGETYIAVVVAGALGVVMVERTTQECRKTSVRKAIWEAIKGA